MSTAQSATLVRRAFLGEALFHVSTIPLLTHPVWYLSLFFIRASDITPAVVFFARVFAGIILFGMTPMLLYGVPNTHAAIMSRRPTYVMLSGTEVFLLPMLCVELSRGGEHSQGAVFTTHGTLGFMAILAAPFAFRVYTLYIKPEMMGAVPKDAVGKKT